MEDLLREMVDELRALNSNVESIIEALPLLRPLHDLDDIHSKIEEVGDHITGGSLGIGGNSLGDVADNIASLETTIDLK